MNITVLLNTHQQEEWEKKGSGTATVRFIDSLTHWDGQDADVFIDLLYTPGTLYTMLPATTTLLVNAVVSTCSELPAGAIRLNAWPGFLQRSVTELATADTAGRQKAVAVMNALGWQYQWAPDIPGMITAPVIAMIINEGWFALEEGVSTPEEIDTAMKLGTNYPYGPFEWCKKIGAAHILGLLKRLALSDKRYMPATLLQQEVQAIAS